MKVYKYSKQEKIIMGLATILIMLFICLPISVFATDERIEVEGTTYGFDKSSHYEFQESNDNLVVNKSVYGTFAVTGNIEDFNDKDGVPSYEVTDGNLTFYYNYSDTLLTAPLDSWHLIEDKSKKLDDIALEDNIGKGAIIIQTSNDRKNWVDVSTITNAFSDVPIRTSPIYTSTAVELINGCYYRVIVAYELRIKMEDSNFLFFNTDKYDYRKYAEVYEFYAFTDAGESQANNSNETYNLGTKVRVKNFDGYFGEEIIDNKDIHYGWDLGNFFVSGYTDEVKDDNGDVVFLKNVGNKVTLWFKLNENINALQGDEDLAITNDTDGYDQYFETPKMDFGKGALIIRYTDNNNVTYEPTIYTNYLEANTSVNADTKVQLFEEGDYEVALDYEITSDKLIDKIGHYRIFFKFSVRNGNCMIYPFDISTGNELSNGSITENGFRLDLAKSKYLKINIKREVLKDSEDGLIEDTRFNGPAKDGAEYTEEGVYTITAHNEYTNIDTVKKIYVGTNDILKAYITSGLSIPQINKLVADGAVITDGGNIQVINENETIIEAENPEETMSVPNEVIEQNSTSDHNKPQSTSINLVIMTIIFVACVIVVVILVKKRRKIQLDINNKGTKEDVE